MHRRQVSPPIWIRICLIAILLTLISLPHAAPAQSSPANSTKSSGWPSSPPAAGEATTVVPRLISYSGVLKDALGHSISGITFLIYKDQNAGAPLWMETQNIHPDSAGRYTVQLGSASVQGLPAEIFTSGEGRWLALQIGSEPEQPRVLLVAVPYAMKAADAETLGGLPLSAFVLASPAANAPPAAANQLPSTPAPARDSSAPPPTSSDVTTNGGTANTIPLFTTATNVQSSVLTQTGTGATAKLGIGNATPAATLDVKGTATIRGALSLPAAAAATAAAGKPSQPESFTASSFSSTTGTPVNQNFRWQAEAAANNTANPSGTLNLLYGIGTAAPTETGLKLSSTGLFTFASGQTFPGAGTITGVTAGSGLIGGGTNGNISLSLPTTCATNQILKWNGSSWACSADVGGSGTITGVTAGAALTGGGTTGTVTLNLDTTKVPQLNAANIFTANQTITGNLTTSGSATATAFNASGTYNLGGAAFAFGSSANSNTALGFAGSLSTTGTHNTGVGVQALSAVSTGAQNTGVGAQALDVDTTGSNNTAVGQDALANNTTGSSNTALGFQAGPDISHLALTNATALGANAVVSESNALILGGTGANAVSVGIGTPMPASTLDVRGTANFTGLVTFASGQKFPGTGVGTITGVTAGTALTGGGTTGTVTLNLDTTKVVTGVTAGTGLTGGGTGGVPTLNLDTTKVPLLSNTNQFTSPNSFSSSGLGAPTLKVSNFGVGDGIDVSSASNAAISTTNSPFGVNATGGNYPIIGTQGLYEGVYGDSYTDANFTAGVVGMEHGPKAATIGVFGQVDSLSGWGVYGQNQTSMSYSGSTHGYPAGVWADGGSDGVSLGIGVGLNATADIGAAVYANNSSDQYPTIAGLNSDPNGYPFSVGNTTNDSGCSVDNNGNLGCTGSKNAVVKIDGGARRVALAAIESPKNWFEDFGSAQLVNGVAVVTLEPDFAQTVNTETDYKVFPVPNGDCKGLYVTRKTATSFEVRELGGGTSSVTFDYRITALRKNYENIRLADHSKDPVPSRMAPKRITTPGSFDSRKLIPPIVAARSAAVHHSAERNAKQ